MSSKLHDLVAKTKKKIAENTNRKEKTTKLQPGKTVVRILPGWDHADQETFFHAFGEHWIKDTEGNLKAVLVCADKTFDKPCEVCDLVSEGISGAGDDEKLIKALKESTAKQRYLVNAVLTEKDASNPVILELPQTVFGQILENIEEHGAIFDLEEGQDLLISREGTGLNTEYSVVVRSKAKSKPVPESVYLKAHNLAEYVDQEVESRMVKAKAALGTILGRPSLAAAGSSAALTGPKSKPSVATEGEGSFPSASEDDDTPVETSEAEDAEYEEVEDEPKKDEPKKAASKPDPESEGFGDDLSESDIEAMLGDL
ncbi:hypothetical protein AY600_02060 [Phormidium willei BDU 130791]|nr:hypothetical protein AY600_02060 [Phormidium willei BDU 130791]